MDIDRFKKYYDHMILNLPEFPTSFSRDFPGDDIHPGTIKVLREHRELYLEWDKEKPGFIQSAQERIRNEKEST